MAKKYVVAVYLEDMQYGGPEEGGWWYLSGELVRPIRIFGNSNSAYEYAYRMNEKLTNTLNRGRRSISSMASEGLYAASVHEDGAPSYFPQNRPYYE